MGYPHALGNHDWPRDIAQLCRSLGSDLPIFGEMERALIKPLPVQPIHAAAVDDLPMLHGDPFDRFLIVTAAHEGMTFLTHDEALGDYGDFVLVV
jgi:PIN domain nuclease of toxin-antitoxin system